jgi:hypothetical protein
MKRKSENKQTRREEALLSELNSIEAQLAPQQVNEMTSNVTKMTGPDDNLCACCGRVY